MSKPTRLPTSPRPVAESARYPHDGILLFFLARTGRQASEAAFRSSSWCRVRPFAPHQEILLPQIGEGRQTNRLGRLPTLVPPQSPPVSPCDGKYRQITNIHLSSRMSCI